MTEADSEMTKYLNEIGFGDPTWELGSKSKVPEVRLAENKILSKLRDHHLVAGGGALQLDEVVVRAIGCRFSRKSLGRVS